MLLWDKARDFLQRAFTVIFVATLAIWFLESFDLHLNFVTDSSRSLLASIGASSRRCSARWALRTGV